MVLCNTHPKGGSKMKKTAIFTIITIALCAISAGAQSDKLAKLQTSNAPVETLEQISVNTENEVGNDFELAQKVLQIKKLYDEKKENTLYFQVNVLKANMDIYQLSFTEDGAPKLIFVESLLAGTPKFKEYPEGFGVVTSRTLNPVWGPTNETVKEFKKNGIDLEKFRNSAGVIIIPPGNKLNFMGAAKLNIQFITPQKTQKLRRYVYRIHGTLPSLEKKLGTRCSGGCTRLSNANVKRILKESKDSAIIVQYI